MDAEVSEVVVLLVGDKTHVSQVLREGAVPRSAHVCCIHQGVSILLIGVRGERTTVDGESSTAIDDSEGDARLDVVEGGGCAEIFQVHASSFRYSKGRLSPLTYGGIAVGILT